jgi:hypothetical protein
MTRALLVCSAAACVVSPLTAVAGLDSPVRVAAALLLFCLAPGAAALPLFTPRSAGVELGLVVGFSLAACAVTAQAMLWAGAWSPIAATCLLAAACLVPIAWQLARPRSPAPEARS